jgi:hypothetical protein
MSFYRGVRALALGGMILALAGCGGFGGFRSAPVPEEVVQEQNRPIGTVGQRQSTLFDLFSNADNPNTTVNVNRYIWNASLEVLNFLPVQSVDPFSGVIVTGFGTPPGGGRSYRATVYVRDPALDARSLKVALQGAGGAPVANETVRAVEDAILTRARQLRAQDGRL